MYLSGQSRLPAHYHKRKLGFYSLYSFGVPALLTLLVAIVHKNEVSEDVEDADASYWRPGIGEDSCWLSSCSKGQLLYFYL